MNKTSNNFNNKTNVESISNSNSNSNVNEVLNLENNNTVNSTNKNIVIKTVPENVRASVRNLNSNQENTLIKFVENNISEMDFPKNLKKNGMYNVKNVSYIKNNNKSFFEKPFGLYDPLGYNVNPFTMQPYENLYKHIPIIYDSGPLKGTTVPRTYRNLSYVWTAQLLYKHMPEMIDAVKNNQVSLIAAPTGTGKTVIIPKVPLQAFYFQKKVLCTCPKKVTVIDNAQFASQALDVELGSYVGYYYKGDRKANEKTMLTFTTPGSLKSNITGDDPYLSNYDVVILDEVHERSKETDQLFLMMKEIMRKRPDFRLVLMSATVSLEQFEDYFGKEFSMKTLSFGDTTSFEIKLYYEPKPINMRDWMRYAVQRTFDILNSTEKGDIIVFIRAKSDGNRMCQELNQKLVSEMKRNNFVKPFCVVLASGIKDDDKDYAVDELLYLSHPNGPFNRKVVMATNVAESSITVKGAEFVIDCGLAYDSWYNPKTDSNMLLNEYISQAAANQRKGRVGRTKPGVCYRLYTEDQFNHFEKYPVPTIQRTDITNDLLDFLRLEYIPNIGAMNGIFSQMMSPPKPEFIEAALDKLFEMNAITAKDDTGTLTDLGFALSRFRGIPIQQAYTILMSSLYRCRYEVINMFIIAGLVQNRIEYLFEEPRMRKDDKNYNKEKAELQKKQKKFHSKLGDYFTCLNVYEALQKHIKTYQESNVVSLMPNNEKKKIKYSGMARKWCKDNGIVAKVFVKNDEKRWDNIGEMRRKINDVLMKITRDYKNKQLIPEPPKLYQTREENILMALYRGMKTHTAWIINKSRGLFTTIYPIVRTTAFPDKNTTMSKPYTKLVIYDELFQDRKDAVQNLKLNICTKGNTSILKDLLSVEPDFHKKIQIVEKNLKKKPSPNKHKKAKGKKGKKPNMYRKKIQRNKRKGHGKK